MEQGSVIMPSLKPETASDWVMTTLIIVTGLLIGL